MQLSQNSLASLISPQGSGSIGAFHRSSPTGGLAKGISFQPNVSGLDSNPLIFPHNYIIDTKHKTLLKIVNDQMVDEKPITQQLWMYPEEVDLL